MAGVLALDLGVTTGWAYADGPALEAWPDGGAMHQRGAGPAGVRHGTITFTERGLVQAGYAMPAPFNDGARWFFYGRWLWGRLIALVPDQVVFEAPLPSARGSAIARGMAAHTESLCWLNRVACFEAHNATVKKHFTGSGAARKPDPRSGDPYRVEEACRERGWAPANWDEADALAILDYAAACRPRREAA